MAQAALASDERTLERVADPEVRLDYLPDSKREFQEPWAVQCTVGRAGRLHNQPRSIGKAETAEAQLLLEGERRGDHCRSFCCSCQVIGGSKEQHIPSLLPNVAIVSTPPTWTLRILRTTASSMAQLRTVRSDYSAACHPAVGGSFASVKN